MSPSWLQPLDDRTALWCYLLAVAAVYTYYTLGVIHDICAFLDIHCLTIHPRQRKKQT